MRQHALGQPSAHDGVDGWCRAALDDALQCGPMSATIEGNFAHGRRSCMAGRPSNDRWLMLPSQRWAVATDPVLLAWRKAIHQLRRDLPHPLHSLVHHDPGMLQGNVERPPFDHLLGG